MKFQSLLVTALASSFLLLGTTHSHAQAKVEEIEEDTKEVKMVTFLGVETSRVSKALRNHVDIPDGTGLTIDHVAEGSGAEEAGIQQYDILLMLDDQIIVNQEQLSTLVRSKQAGDKVNVEVLRKGKKIKMRVELGEREARKHRQFGHNFSFPRPNPPKPPFLEDWDFEFDTEEFEERMKEIQEKAAEFGNKALEYIPEIMIEREGEDGSKRITTIGRGKKTAIISNEDLTAKMETVDGKKHFLIKEKSEDDGKIIYEGGMPDQAKLDSLPENVRDVISRLNKTNSLNLDTKGDLKSKNIKIRINTGKEEAKAPTGQQPRNKA